MTSSFNNADVLDSHIWDPERSARGIDSNATNSFLDKPDTYSVAVSIVATSGNNHVVGDGHDYFQVLADVKAAYREAMAAKREADMALAERKLAARWRGQPNEAETGSSVTYYEHVSASKPEDSGGWPNDGGAGEASVTKNGEVDATEEGEASATKEGEASVSNDEKAGCTSDKDKDKDKDVDPDKDKDKDKDKDVDPDKDKDKDKDKDVDPDKDKDKDKDKDVDPDKDKDKDKEEEVDPDKDNEEEVDPDKDNEEEVDPDKDNEEDVDPDHVEDDMEGDDEMEGDDDMEDYDDETGMLMVTRKIRAGATRLVVGEKCQQPKDRFEGVEPLRTRRVLEIALNGATFAQGRLPPPPKKDEAKPGWKKRPGKVNARDFPTQYAFQEAAKARAAEQERADEYNAWVREQYEANRKRNMTDRATSQNALRDAKPGQPLGFTVKLKTYAQGQHIPYFKLVFLARWKDELGREVECRSEGALLFDARNLASHIQFDVYDRHGDLDAFRRQGESYLDDASLRQLTHGVTVRLTFHVNLPKHAYGIFVNDPAFGPYSADMAQLRGIASGPYRVTLWCNSPVVVEKMVDLAAMMSEARDNDPLGRWIVPGKRAFVRKGHMVPRDLRPTYILGSRPNFRDRVDALVTEGYGDIQDHEYVVGMGAEKRTKLQARFVEVAGSNKHVLLMIVENGIKDEEDPLALQLGDSLIVRIRALNPRCLDWLDWRGRVVDIPGLASPQEVCVAIFGPHDKDTGKHHDFDLEPLGYIPSYAASGPTDLASFSRELDKAKPSLVDYSLILDEKQYKRAITSLEGLQETFDFEAARDPFRQSVTEQLYLGNDYTDLPLQSIFTGLSADSIREAKVHAAKALTSAQMRVFAAADEAPARNLVITGPAGAGKTKIALHLALPFLLDASSAKAAMVQQGSSGPTGTSVQPASAEQVQPAPAEQVQPAPAEQVQPAPAEQVQPAPAEQVQPTPAEQVQPTPAEQVQPTPAEQVQPTPAEQVQPTPAEQVQPTPAEQVQPTPAEQVQPTPAEQVQPTPAEQVQPASAEKVQPASAEKVQPASAEKVQPAPGEPIETDTADVPTPRRQIILTSNINDHVDKDAMAAAEFFGEIVPGGVKVARIYSRATDAKILRRSAIVLRSTSREAHIDTELAKKELEASGSATASLIHEGFRAATARGLMPINDPRLKDPAMLYTSFGYHMGVRAGIERASSELDPAYAAFRDYYGRWAAGETFDQETRERFGVEASRLYVDTLQDMDVLCMTAASLADTKIFLNARAAIIIVDEATRLPPASSRAIFAFWNATPARVWLGDPQQSRPQATAPAEVNGFALQGTNPIFVRWLATGFPTFSLTEQFRYVSDINDVVSPTFYRGAVTSAPASDRRGSYIALKHRILPKVLGHMPNTDPPQPRSTLAILAVRDSVEEKVGPTQSKINVETARATWSMLAALIREGASADPPLTASKVAILAPYVGQTQLHLGIRQGYIASDAAAAAWASDVYITTFEKSQGQQRNVLLLDLTGVTELGFLKSSTRACTGLTRGMDGVLIVASQQLLDTLTSTRDQSRLGSLCRMIKERGNVVTMGAAIDMATFKQYLPRISNRPFVRAPDDGLDEIPVDLAPPSDGEQAYDHEHPVHQATTEAESEAGFEARFEAEAEAKAEAEIKEGW